MKISANGNRAHMREIRRTHRIGLEAIRPMIDLDLLPASGEPIAPHHKRPDETLPEFAERTLAAAGPLSEAGHFAHARAQLAAARSLVRVRLPDHRIEESLAFLARAGRTGTAGAVSRLLGGEITQNRDAIRRLRPPIVSASQRALMAAIDIGHHHLQAMIRFGLVPDPDGPDAVPLAGRAAHGLRREIGRRFSEWTPDAMSFQDVKDVAVIRSGLRLGAVTHHSPGIVDATIDLVIANGQVATILELERLLGGDRAQFDDHLRDRARTRGDVPLPPRVRRGLATLADLAAALPGPMATLYDTALDPVRGSSRDHVSRADMLKIIENPHAQLQVAGAVATLHGARRKAWRFKATGAARAAANLALPLMGTDITNGAQLAAGLAAHRALLRASTDRHEVQRANDDVDAWRFLIALFDDYLSRADLPEETRAFLADHRPAFPSGGDALFRQVRHEIDDFNETSKTLRNVELRPYLADVPRFLGMVQEAHEEFKALRDHIRADTLGREVGGAILEHAFAGSFETEARLPDGSDAGVVYNYRIHPWPKVVASVQKPRRDRPSPQKRKPETTDPFNAHPGDDGLFENRYAVEMTGCTRDGEPIDYPLAIIRLHRDYAFWQPNGCPDGATLETRYGALREFGLSANALSYTGTEIANFGKFKFAWARKARLRLGLFILPLEEIHHSNLIGALHVSSRAVSALRVGELTQWNVGSGLETGYDENGEPFAILSSIPKKKVAPRRTPLDRHCEDLADELLTLASERFHQGGPIPKLKRPFYNGKGEEFESAVFGARERGLTPSAINASSRLLMGGVAGFKSHYMKYIWSKLGRMAGMDVEQRMDAHGHSRAETTEAYDVLTDDEEAADLRIRKQQAELRAGWLRGERDTPLPDAPVEALRFRQRRLANDAAFLEKEGAGVELDRVRAELRLLDAKIARAATR